MDGVKVALDNRGMTVEAARQCAKRNCVENCRKEKHLSARKRHFSGEWL